MLRPRVKLALAALLVASASAGTAHDDEVFSFRDDFVEKACHGIQFDYAEIVCTVRAKLGDHDLGGDFVFLAEKENGAEVWAWVDFPLNSLAALWTGGEFNADPEIPQTQEWGWMYDRNGDGRVDWIAYVDGSVLVVPEEGLPSGMPSVKDGEIHVTEDQLEILEQCGQVRYWHVFDRNFNDSPDHIIVTPVSVENGWSEGAMLMTVHPAPGHRIGDCTWRSDYDAEDTLACKADNGAYITFGEAQVRRAEPQLDVLDLTFGVVQSLAARCDFGPKGIEAHP